MSGRNSIQVAIKLRPLFRKEKDQNCWRVVDNSIQLVDSQSEPYYFDHIFDQDATNQIIFDKMAKQIVHSAIQGFNGTIFAYGQTSSGKTYTMMGDDDNPGVMVLAAKEIFKEIERAQDRQFLLRVGYIEIYNEKIYDLLNKKNQDLKIHETSTGIVSVNCEECIIRSEDDLLNHLNKGGKERTVGETNMNERSSRSHAIFRIIIESRKMDRTEEDDAVIQSVINLVDLAGSERADQTGARGTRLKEGGHINKSLLFLSNVIKRLSENEDDKYVSFRDSKLTRILQASLGGNALTAIICTIKPNAVEETHSTLNFALRAKAIKNKPQVNEIISDATMMKRLEHEIKVLKTRLEEEQRKNESQIKVRQLEQRIKDEDLKIISCNSLHSIRNREKRRRTWCPSSTNLDASTVGQQPSALPVPTIGNQFVTGLPHTSRLQAPKVSYYNTPLITMRPPTEPPSAPKFGAGLPLPPENLPEIDEEFAPAEMVNFEMLSPLHTPRNQQLQRNFSITPKLTACARSTLEKVEHDLLELQSFTNLENKAEVQHEPDLALKRKVETLSQRNAVLENERLEYLQLKDEIVITTENLSETQKRCDELQIQLSKLTNSNKEANQKIAKYEAELAELKKTNEKLEMENREAVNLEFEFQRHKNKSKLRENELLEALNDKEKEICKLEKSLNTITAERLQNSKEELLQKSQIEGDASNVDGKVCVKCEDLQRLLEDNKKVTLEFEKLTLEYEKLKLNYVEIEKENDSNKLRIVQLEELQEKEKAECEKLLKYVQHLREKLQNVQRDYEQLSSENSSKHDECMALNRQVEVAREEMVVLEEKFTKLELSWQEQQQTINDIEKQYASIQTKYEELQNQYEQLENTKGQSLADCQRLEQDNVELQTEIEDLKKKVQDAQQRLLESNEKYEETAKENKTANEEYTAETFKIQQENEQLRKQLQEIQTQFEDLQKEYDDLSNQLMDNLQDSESLKNENTKLLEKLQEYEDKNEDVCRAEAEIQELKSQLEKVLTSEKKTQLKTPSPGRSSSMRSSGVCVEEEEDYEEYPQSQDLLRKFCELSESLTEIELEHTKGKTKVFRSASKNSTPNSYKMYLKNIMGVRKSQKEFDMEIENIHLQGSFKHHSFHIVELSGEAAEDNYDKSCEMECDTSVTNGCENMTEYIEKLKEEIVQLKAINEQERLSNKSLLESTERAFSEMREQITQLSAELLEKSIFVENCACKTYQQQIETLEKEKADITIICEELQEKVNCTLNGSFNMLMNTTAPGVEVKALTEDKLNELEQLKRREQELLESFDSQTKTLEELTQRYLDMEADLETAREQLETQEKEFKEKNNQLQLEILQKLELSASEYRDNMKKYNKEWEERKEEYEETIKSLRQQIEDLKQQTIATPEKLKQEIKQEIVVDIENNETVKENLENVCDKVEDREEQLVGEAQEDVEMPEDIETIKQDRTRLEEEKQNLQQQLNTVEMQLENLKEENRTQYEEIALLDSKIESLEELLNDAKHLHETVARENASLETQIKDLEEDLNCIPQLHDKNQQLNDKIEKLNGEYTQLQDKLQKAELQIQEFCKEDAKREEQIQTLQSKLNHLAALEEEKLNLTKDFENLKQEYSQIQAKLLNAEEQIQEFCSEDTNREELIQSLQNKLAHMTSVEEEKKSLENECSQLKETLRQLQEKETKTLKEIESLKEREAAINENLSELVKSQSELRLEKCTLEEKLQQVSSDYNLLKTDQAQLESQLSKLTEERKSLNEQCLLLQEEKTTLEEQLKCLKEKEKAEELLEQMIKEKAELIQNLRLTTEKLEIAQNQLEEKAIENTQIQQDLQSLKDTLSKSIEEKQQQLEETERNLEKSKQDNVNLHQELQTLKEILCQVNEEKQEQQMEMEKHKQESQQLKEDLVALKEQLTKIQQEKQEQQLNLEKAQQQHNNLQQELETFKLALSKAMEEKQQQFNNLENNYQTSQQQNQQLQQNIQDLQVALSSSKEEQQQQLNENTQLQNELQSTKQSLAKLQEEQQNLQEKLLNYEKLNEDKNKLEATLNILKSAQSGALNSLQEERDQLQLTLQQYEQQNKQYKEKEETLQGKIEALHQHLHEVRSKAQSYEKLLQEHEEVEIALTSTTATNQKLQQEIQQLTSQQETYASMIENLSCEIEKLNLQLDKHLNEKEMLQTKLSHLNQTLQGEQSSLQRNNQELKSSLDELKLKYESLQSTNTQMEQLNQQLVEQLKGLQEKLIRFNGVQEELNLLKVQHSELQLKMKETVEEAGRCSLTLRDEVEHHKQLLQKQAESFNLLKVEMETQQQTLTDENHKLSQNIETLQSEKLALEDKLREITVRNFEQDLQRQAIDATANTSIDSNTSYSPKGRRSLERMGGVMGSDFKANVSIEEKLSAMQQKNSTTAERKNRRISTHDERRRQSYWGAAHDKETMTEPVDTSCNCIELDRKLKECERNLFIKNSQVTALSMELKNHPLKDENAALMKRFQEEQDKHRIEIKRYKNKLYEQTAKAEKAIAAAAHATAKSQHVAANAALAAEQQTTTPVLPKVVADVEIQTDDDLSNSIQKLQGKYNDLKNICRYRYNVIKELEEKVAQKENSDGNSLSALDAAQYKVLNNQCESLKKELKTVKEKYENAKKVLHSRREEIMKLRAELEKSQ
ncbi:hypothetical protein FF38_07584 [Lucilia cuprina]|uniref:Centromere-associated protein E n=1 Tax=Lucilia cuprina TaxID=7375 RepID=A0A0L0BZI6_LUCCU|nr:Kinesin-like protein KIN-7L [Lucilia cuprina]KNC25376.1 hypothetical protein FF38_07584 [Lucilia cuprina]